MSLSYTSQYQSLTSNTSPTVGDYLYYDNNGTVTATEWVILDVNSDNDIRYKKNQSGWSTSQQKERGIGWTGSGWTEDPWSLSGDKEPDLLSTDGTFASASATVSDASTIYTWTTGGNAYAEGSFISPFYSSPPQTNSVNTGLATQNLDGSLSFQVNSSSDANETYSIALSYGSPSAYINPVGVGPWYHNMSFAVHSAIGYGTWRLSDQNNPNIAWVTTTAPSAPGTGDSTSTTKKCHCNFW